MLMKIISRYPLNIVRTQTFSVKPAEKTWPGVGTARCMSPHSANWFLLSNKRF
jgi:hypothetical protein